MDTSARLDAPHTLEATMDTLINLFVEHHVSRLLSAKHMRRTIVRHFGPLRQHALPEVTPLVLLVWFNAIGTHSHSTANACASIVKCMFEFAITNRLYSGENPAARLKKFPSRARDRFVVPEEMPRLQRALVHATEQTQCFILLCLLTGCRKTEALTMRWADVDVLRGVWRKPHTKTGVHLIPIPRTLLDRLLKLPRLNEWVLGTVNGHLTATVIYRRWNRIRWAADLGDVTIHDLRRSCASWLAIHGENLAVISRGVLNHASLNHTGIYARLTTAPVALALEKNSERMLGATGHKG